MKRPLLIGMLSLLVGAAYSQESTHKNQEERISALESKVDKMGQLKFTGYIQTQWTWDQSKTSSGTQNDFSVRRGRLKVTYSNKYGEAVIQLDATEDGVGIKDAYFQLKEPSIEWVSLRGGIFDRPFGYEISYSSNRRETPERSTLFRTLFPNERELGAELVFEGPDDSFLKGFTLNAGLFSGNSGQASETDSHKDFIGHLAYQKSTGTISYGLGTSLYAGGVRLAGDETQRAYKMINGNFAEDTDLAPGDYATRRYYGFDGQFSISSALGTTSLRAEYLWGTQPGAADGSRSPTGAITSDIYSRNFNGYYLYFIQDIGCSKHSVVARYDAYDPNTKVSKDECLNDGDIAMSTLGFGWLFRANQHVRLMAYYELKWNEKADNDMVSAKYSENMADNHFTLRLQYKF